MKLSAIPGLALPSLCRSTLIAFTVSLVACGGGNSPTADPSPSGGDGGDAGGVSTGPGDTGPDVQAVSAGFAHTIVLRSDGSVFGWGNNLHGELGDGTTTNRATAVALTSAGVAKAVAAGNDHSLVLHADGTVWATGMNDHNQLGDGTTAQRSAPVQVPGIAGVEMIRAGGLSSFAQLADGSVYAWGDNRWGQLGIGGKQLAPVPQPVTVLNGVKDIRVSEFVGLALRDDGTVLAWGQDMAGELGGQPPGPTDHVTPTQVPGLMDIVAIAAGDLHAIALRSDGTVFTWGNNAYGQLGVGETPQYRLTPAMVVGPSGVKAVSASSIQSLAISNGGTALAWGDNDSGSLGDGTMIERKTPANVPLLNGATMIAKGFSHTVFVAADGTVWSFGRNVEGRLGDGTTTDSLQPVLVQGLAVAAKP